MTLILTFAVMFLCFLCLDWAAMSVNDLIRSSSLPVVGERAMYFVERSGGHCSIGAIE